MAGTTSERLDNLDSAILIGTDRLVPKLMVTQAILARTLAAAPQNIAVAAMSLMAVSDRDSSFT